MPRFLEAVMGRRWVAWTVLALAVLVLVVSSLTVWVRRQALDTDNWVDVSGRLLQDEEVRQAVAADLVDSLFTNTDVQARLQRALPTRLDPFVAPATGLLREAARTAAEDLLARPAVQSLWEEANRQAHRRLVAILEGESDPLLRTDGGAVVLDLRPLVEKLAERLGITVTLAPGAARYTILRSDQLQAAQDGVNLLRRLSVLLVILVVALAAFAVYVARGFRREMVRGVALGMAGVGVLLLVVRRLVGDAVVESLTSAANRDAGRSVWLIGTELLRDEAVALIIYGLVLLAGVTLVGPARWALWLRRRLAPAMRDHLGLVYAAVAAVFLLVLLWAPSASGRRLAGILVLAALVAGGVEYLRRQVQRESAQA